MIDAATVERYMRDANPLPNLDDINADEFARFVAAAHTRRAAIMQAPTQHPTEPTPTTPQPPKGRSRRVWAFAAAFIIVLVGVGLAALLLSSEKQPVVDEPAPPTTIVDTTEPSFDVESLVWTRVPHVAAVFGGAEMVSVTVGGPGFVAVGGSEDAPAVWTSRDGVTWDRVPHDPTVFDVTGYANPAEITAVTDGGPGLVAVGEIGGRAAVWTSRDGINWTRLPRLRQLPVADSDAWRGAYVEDGRLNGIHHSESGLITVGDGVAWTSPNGITWSSSSATELGPVIDVTAGGPGFVAVGWEEPWTSPDGVAWTPVPWDDAVFSAWPLSYMASVTKGGPGLVAVGQAFVSMPESHIAAAVWMSTDGITWSRVILEEDSEAMLYNVVSVGDGLVAVGSSEDGATAWISNDGATWSRVPHNDTVSGKGEIASVTAGPEGIVAVGRDGDDAAVWIAVPND